MGPFLSVVDFRNRNVQLVAEVLGCVEDCQALGLRPEVKLVTRVSTDMAVELVRRDIDDEGAWIITASPGTETALPISTLVKRLNFKQS